MNRFTKIGEEGLALLDDAEKWIIVLDNTTRLMWTVEETEGMSHKKALAAATNLTTGGFADWRLPTVEELLTLADRTRHAPAIDTAYFPRCESDWYWTSTPAASPPRECAWYVAFSNGSTNWYPNSGEGFVRAVRASQ